MMEPVPVSLPADLDDAPVLQRLSVLDRFLPLWIGAAMVLGIVMGTMVEQAFVTSLIKSDGSVLPAHPFDPAAPALSEAARSLGAAGEAIGRLLGSIRIGKDRGEAGAEQPDDAPLAAARQVLRQPRTGFAGADDERPRSRGAPPRRHTAAPGRGARAAVAGW